MWISPKKYLSFWDDTWKRFEHNCRLTNPSLIPAKYSLGHLPESGKEMLVAVRKKQYENATPRSSFLQAPCLLTLLQPHCSVLQAGPWTQWEPSTSGFSPHPTPFNSGILLDPPWFHAGPCLDLYFPLTCSMVIYSGVCAQLHSDDMWGQGIVVVFFLQVYF